VKAQHKAIPNWKDQKAYLLEVVGPFCITPSACVCASHFIVSTPAIMPWCIGILWWIGGVVQNPTACRCNIYQMFASGDSIIRPENHHHHAVIILCWNYCYGLDYWRCWCYSWLVNPFWGLVVGRFRFVGKFSNNNGRLCIVCVHSSFLEQEVFRMM
jgi:hypothetical protein